MYILDRNLNAPSAADHTACENLLVISRKASRAVTTALRSPSSDTSLGMRFVAERADLESSLVFKASFSRASMTIRNLLSEFAISLQGVFCAYQLPTGFTGPASRVEDSLPSVPGFTFRCRQRT